MARSIAPWILAGAVALVPACKKKETQAGPFDPLAMIPASARTVGGVDLTALQASAVWRRQEARVRSEAKAVVDGLVACDLDLPRWQRVTFGVGSSPEALAFVVQAQGVGKSETLACLSTTLAEQEAQHGDGKAPWTMQADGKVLHGEAGRRAFVLGDDAVVVAGSDWAAEVEALVKGQGASAASTTATLLGRTDPTKTVWFAGTLPEEAKAMIQLPDGAPVPRDVAGWLDLREGLEVMLAVGFGSAEEAATTRATMAEQLADTKAMAAGLGVPQATLDSLALGTAGEAVTLTAKVSEDDLQAIEAQVQQLLGS